jgi:hypothetical protein
MALELEKEILAELIEENDGLLTVDAVLEAAADETNPLHKHFEWDDSKAANDYRRWQARALIARCRIVIESRDDVAVRAFVSLPSDRLNEGGGYRYRTDVLDNEDQRTELLRDMQKRVSYWSQQATWLDLPTRRALEQFSSAVETAVGQVQQAA